MTTGQQMVSRADDKLIIPNTFLVTADFFKLFSYPLLQGDANTALKEPRSVVLSHSTAKKLFHGDNAMGQTVTIYNLPMKVTAIMADMPANSHLNLSLLVSYATWQVIDPVPQPTIARNSGSLTVLLLMFC